MIMVEDPITDARPEVIGIIVKATATGGCECIVGNYISVTLAKVMQIKIMKVEVVGIQKGFLSKKFPSVRIHTYIQREQKDLK